MPFTKQVPELEPEAERPGAERPEQRHLTPESSESEGCNSEVGGAARARRAVGRRISIPLRKRISWRRTSRLRSLVVESLRVILYLQETPGATGLSSVGPDFRKWSETLVCKLLSWFRLPR